MSHKVSSKTINPTISINPNQLHDDVVERALANGFSMNEIERYLSQQEYRKAYNLRPEVKAKRAERYLRMKELRSLLK